VRGYGFIAPDSGSEDVFVHANDLEDEKSMFKAGTAVEFEVEEGDRGLKAVDVRVIGQPVATSASDFAIALSETLMTRVPDLTGAQILKVRQAVAEVARSRGVGLS